MRGGRRALRARLVPRRGLGLWPRGRSVLLLSDVPLVGREHARRLPPPFSVSLGTGRAVWPGLFVALARLATRRELEQWPERRSVLLQLEQHLVEHELEHRLPPFCLRIERNYCTVFRPEQGLRRSSAAPYRLVKILLIGRGLVGPRGLETPRSKQGRFYEANRLCL